MNDTAKNMDTGSITTDTWLAQLSKGLMILNLEKEMEDAAYSAMDRITLDRQAIVQRRQQFCSDIERVLSEIKLTNKLLSETTGEIVVGDKLFPPEEIINYYNGVFLDQVHQIKDKLFRMVALLLIEQKTALDSQKKDPKKIKYKPFLDKYKDRLVEIGIYDLLKEWGSGNLIRVLNKRTNYHHLVSTLPLNNDYQKVKMSKLALNPVSSSSLSEFGKKRLAEIGEESYKRWRDGIVEKLQSIVDEIEENIELVSEKFILNYKIPVKPEDLAVTVNKYTQFLSSQDIVNQANLNKIDPLIKEIIDAFVKFCIEVIGDKLVSVYLVGSSGRGEFIPGTSDINIYVITNIDNCGSYSSDDVRPMNAIFLGKNEFLSEEHKKDRFICWSDGLLLHGEEIKFDKKELPKPGSILTLLLNRNFVEKLEKIKTDVAVLKKPNAKKLRPHCLKAVKIIMDWDFGVAMANKPFYTASRTGKLSYTKGAWPNERRTLTLEQLYMNNATITQSDFPLLIDVFFENAKPNLRKLLDIEKGTKNS